MTDYDFEDTDQNNSADDNEASQFKPKKRGTEKQKFTANEDLMLQKIVKEEGTENWNKIAAKIPGRTPRQCRERWKNYLNPALSSEPWKSEEDELLLQKYEEFGSHWKSIRTFLPHRSTNNIKNRLFLLKRQSKRKKPAKQLPSNEKLNKSTKQNQSLEFLDSLKGQLDSMLSVQNDFWNFDDL